MGDMEFATQGLLLDDDLRPERQALAPQELRAAALADTPARRSEFTRTVSVDVDHYRMCTAYIDGLISRSRRTDRPGGLWLLGSGGVGKTFILESIYARYKPLQTTKARRCPVLTVRLASRPSVSDILLTLILQLGQKPSTLRYKNNAELEMIAADAMQACGVLAILFDEAHHLFLNTTAKRIADRFGGIVGDFLKLFYDRVGTAFVFAATPGLEEFIDVETQSNTRWTGRCKLQPFENDAKFRGVLQALDAAIPMPEKCGLASEPFASRIFTATNGNFRVLKNLLAEAVYIAASEGAASLTNAHLKSAFFLSFCSETTPFDEP